MGILLPELKAQDNCEVKAIVHQHIPGQPYQREVIDQIEVIRVPSYGRLLFAPISPAFPFYLNREIHQFKPDILHIHMPNTSVFWLLLNRQARNIPWVIHWHSDVVSSQYATKLKYTYPFYRPFEKAMLRQSKAIIATSPDYLDSSQTLSPWRDKCHIIPLGLRLNDLPPLTESQGLDVNNFWQEGQTRLLSIGRLTYYKGHRYLIEAMQYVPNAQLVIVGTGELEASLNSQIQELNLTTRVQLSGKLDNHTLHDLLQSCDIFCLSSIERTEAFGLVLLEAMAYAKPIVVSKVEGSGMNWVTQDKLNALFAEKGNSQDFARQLNALIPSSKTQKRLGSNGRERLLDYFQIKTISFQIENVYRSLNQN